MSNKIGAVIVAAGAGMRLGGVAKALLRVPSGPAWMDAGSSRLPGATFLEQIVATARTAGLEMTGAVIVVGPPFGDDVATHARELGLRIVENRQPERGMASSVALGYGALVETGCDAAWLWPVDHPDVLPSTLHALIAGLGANDAARPIASGRGGHPPLITRTLWPQLSGCGNLDGGARAVLANARMADVIVDDPGCIRDVDTAIDLEALE